MIYWIERVFINENYKELFLEETYTLSLEIDIKIDSDINENNEELVKKSLLYGFKKSHNIYDL